jgi:hypothetical protein
VALARNGGNWAVDKAITIPAEPAEPASLPPTLQPFGAVPPLGSNINPVPAAQLSAPAAVAAVCLPPGSLLHRRRTTT